LPIGAEIKKGEEYIVRESFINSFDQIAYVLTGIKNEGRTKYGLPWQGYNSQRFEDVDKMEEMSEETLYAVA
ncbi:unnamed protein product, partial [marine sediment metagenome]